jgi:four helix bundle protein
MATITNFEDIIAWQRAREFCKTIFKITGNAEFSKEFRFKSQINASAGSIMDNIAEGYEREGNKEFLQFLSIVKASLAENKSQTYRSFDRKFIDEIEFENTLKLANELKQIIEGFMNYLRNSEIKGLKFKK